VTGSKDDIPGKIMAGSHELPFQDASAPIHNVGPAEAALKKEPRFMAIRHLMPPQALYAFIPVG
jgi:hypothetical protein